MGPYYQKTAQGVGGLVETLYDNPILIVLFVLGICGLGVWLWRSAK